MKTTSLALLILVLIACAGRNAPPVASGPPRSAPRFGAIEIRTTADSSSVCWNDTTKVFYVCNGGITGTQVASAIKDPAASTAGLRTLGTGSTQAAQGSAVLPLTGGTLTGRLTLAPGSGVASLLDGTLPDNNSGSGYPLFRIAMPTSPLSFGLKAFEATFNATVDPVAYLGWNCNGAASAKGRICQEFEGLYNDGSLTNQEWHLAHYKTDGTLIGRVLSFKGDQAGTLDQLSTTAHVFYQYLPDSTLRRKTGFYSGHNYDDVFLDVMRVYDVSDNHVMLNFAGSAINGAGSYSGNISTTNLYFKDASDADKEELTIWGKDSGGARVMLARTTAPPAGGLTDLGLRLGSGSQFGVFFGSGAPTMSANKGALYLESATGLPYYNASGSTSWTALASSSGTTFSGAIRQTPAAATISAGATTIDVSTNNSFQIATQITGDFTIALTNGQDGDSGAIAWKQASAGGKKVTAVTASGRTILMAGTQTTINTTAALVANAPVVLTYSYDTQGGDAVVVLSTLDTAAVAY